MSTASDEILEKIKKLLRVDTKSGATETEVEQALMAAQRLATRYSLDLASIDPTDAKAKDEPIVREEFRPRDEWGDTYQQFPANHKYMAWIIGRFFNVEIIEISGWEKREKNYGMGIKGQIDVRTKKIEFIGRKTNVHIAIYVYQYLHREFTELWRKYKATTNAPMTSRNSFFYGLYAGLTDKLQKEKGTVEAEVQQKLQDEGSSKSLEMVLIGEKERIQQEVTNAHPRLRYIDRDEGDLTDRSALIEGARQGKKININPVIE
jgi:hypothetical protein